MKRIHWLAFLLAVCVGGCSVGCGLKDSQVSNLAGNNDPKTELPADSIVTETDEDTDEDSVKKGAEIIGEALELSEEEIQELIVSEIDQYDDEMVIRYTQTWQGVEVYNSALLAVTGDEQYCAGTYYDFSDAFEDDFSENVEAAEKIPDWLTDQISEEGTVSFDTSTLRCVVYMAEDGEAVLAYAVEASLSDDEETEQVELVISLDGSAVYECSKIESINDFSDVYVDSETMMISEKSDVYYAYNSEYNFYAISELGAGSSLKESQVKELVNKYSSYNYSTGIRNIKFDESVIYQTDSDDWSGGDSAKIMALMQQYYNVTEWYTDNFGWSGLKGDSSLSALLVINSTPNVALNYQDAVVAVGTEVIQSPEVLAHEFCHSVIHEITGTKGSLEENESLALSEAICDTFAALYLGDGSWVIGINTSGPKDIPSNEKTMDDYTMDRYSQVYDDWSMKNSLDYYGIIKIYLDTSNKTAHDNAYIVSHTLYNVWKKALNKDDEAMGQILFRSLRYIPSGGGFSEFRDAFLYTVSVSYDQSTLDAAAGCFANAGITTAGNIRKFIVAEAEKNDDMSVNTNASENVASTSDKDISNPSKISAFEILDYTFSEIQALDWDTCVTADCSTDDYPDWVCTCTYEDETIAFTFYEYAFEDADASAYGISLQSGGMEIPITSGISTGMTYDEIAALDGVDAYFSQWEEEGNLQTADGVSEDFAVYYWWDENWCFISLWYSGSGGSAVLQSVNIDFNS